MKPKSNTGDNRGYTLDALARRMEKNAEADDYRQANAKKRRAFMGAAVRLDDCLLNDNGDERESALLSDKRRGEGIGKHSVCWGFARIAGIDAENRKVVDWFDGLARFLGAPKTLPLMGLCGTPLPLF